MRSVTKVAIISACATFLTGLVVAVLAMPFVQARLEKATSARMREVEKASSAQMRQQSNIPEIMGTKWSTEWYNADGTKHASDEVTFSKWTKNSQFEGYGEVTYGGIQYKYSITGEVAPSRIVVLTYKAERFPTEANIGTACLELSQDAKELNGYWAGRTTLTQKGQKTYIVRSGKVKMKEIRHWNP